MARSVVHTGPGLTCKLTRELVEEVDLHTSNYIGLVSGADEPKQKLMQPSFRRAS